MKPQIGNQLSLKQQFAKSHQAGLFSRVATIQRAAPSSSSKSGRSPDELWDLFVSYKKDQAEQVTQAFLSAGYTIHNAGNEVVKAIRALHLDLPAHGFGGVDSGVQGNLNAVVGTWVTKLKQWASSHPAGGSSKGSSGLEHTEQEKKQAVLEKQKHKMDVSKTKKRQYCEENGHDPIPDTNICKNCGAEI
jgi:hypothetical protein